MYFNLNGDNMRESGKYWSQLHVHIVSVFEAFVPKLIVIQMLRFGACSQLFTSDLVPLAFFCSLLLKLCLLKLKSCFPCSLPYLFNSSMGCLPTRAGGLYWEEAAAGVT